MKRFILKKLIFFLFLVAAVATVVFFLLRAIPGNPTVNILGESASKQDIERFNRTLNLHLPVLKAYLGYMGDLAVFNLGNSLYNEQPVIRSILIYFPNTVYLALFSIGFALVVSFPLSVWSVIRKKAHPFMDALLTLGGSVVLSIPAFFLGPLLVIFFSIKLGWLPVSGSEGIRYIILPALTLGLPLSVFEFRIFKEAFEGEYEKKYILLAKAKGLTEIEIFKNHVFKNALLPVITTLGIQLGLLLGGAIITEAVFSYQGIGNLLVHAIKGRDYPVIRGVVLFITILYLMVVFCIEIAYGYLNPAIRFADEKRKKTD